MHPRELQGQSRSQLIARAELLGVEKATLLTRAELCDEIVRLTVSDPVERRIARGLLGLARDLVASVVERGLHLPEAAKKIRAISVRPSAPPVKPPIATVTLAEIYAAQGHRIKALRVLEEVLAKEPDHAAARQLRDAIAASGPDDPVIAPESDDQPPAPTNGSAAIATAPEVPKAPAAPELAALLEPERDDSDEVVLIPVDQTTVFIYWEIREPTLERARTEDSAGTLVLRLLAVSADWNGPVVETRDLETDQIAGEWLVRDLPIGAVLRAALGWRTVSRFEPLAVAMQTTPASTGPDAYGARRTGPDADGARSAEAPPSAAPTDASDRPPTMTRVGERASERVARAAAVQGSASWIELPLTVGGDSYREMRAP
jgi:hypothetical protein